MPRNRAMLDISRMFDWAKDKSADERIEEPLLEELVEEPRPDEPLLRSAALEALRQALTKDPNVWPYERERITANFTQELNYIMDLPIGEARLQELSQKGSHAVSGKNRRTPRVS